jgi:hypothetical protein
MGHISEHDLERYQLDIMEEPELATIEEHLLWCQECLDRAEAIERFTALLHAGVIREHKYN